MQLTTRCQTFLCSSESKQKRTVFQYISFRHNHPAKTGQSCRDSCQFSEYTNTHVSPALWCVCEKPTMEALFFAPYHSTSCSIQSQEVACRIQKTLAHTHTQKPTKMNGLHDCPSLPVMTSPPPVPLPPRPDFPKENDKSSYLCNNLLWARSPSRLFAQHVIDLFFTSPALTPKRTAKCFRLWECGWANRNTYPLWWLGWSELFNDVAHKWLVCPATWVFLTAGSVREAVWCFFIVISLWEVKMCSLWRYFDLIWLLKG